MPALLSYWNFDFISMAFIALLCFAYLYIVGFQLQKRSLYFFAGIALLIICTASPLHVLGEHYLFSAHMLTHTLILLIAAPLLIAGVPEENKAKKNLLSISRFCGRYPFICWLAGVGVMWFWHVPVIYSHLFTMHSMPVSSAMHSMNALSYWHMLSLLIAGMLFCLPVINPYSSHRIAPLPAVLYLTSACIGCSLLGLLITFAPAGTYTNYITMNGNSEVLHMIRTNWNISAYNDQQAGGLIMWVPCCFIYLSAAMFLLLKWFENKGEGTAIVHHLSTVK